MNDYPAIWEENEDRTMERLIEALNGYSDQDDPSHEVARDNAQAAEAENHRYDEQHEDDE